MESPARPSNTAKPYTRAVVLGYAKKPKAAQAKGALRSVCFAKTARTNRIAAQYCPDSLLPELIYTARPPYISMSPSISTRMRLAQPITLPVVNTIAAPKAPIARRHILGYDLGMP